MSTRPVFLGCETSSDAMDERELDEGLARGVSDGEMFVEGAEEAVADSVVSKRRRGAVSDGKAVVVAMLRRWCGCIKEGRSWKDSPQSWRRTEVLGRSDGRARWR